MGCGASQPNSTEQHATPDANELTEQNLRRFGLSKPAKVPPPKEPCPNTSMLRMSSSVCLSEVESGQSCDSLHELLSNRRKTMRRMSGGYFAEEPSEQRKRERMETVAMRGILSGIDTTASIGAAADSMSSCESGDVNATIRAKEKSERLEFVVMPWFHHCLLFDPLLLPHHDSFTSPVFPHRSPSSLSPGRVKLEGETASQHACSLSSNPQGCTDPKNCSTVSAFNESVLATMAVEAAAAVAPPSNS